MSEPNNQSKMPGRSQPQDASTDIPTSPASAPKKTALETTDAIKPDEAPPQKTTMLSATERNLDRVDSNTKFLVIGAIIGAIITGLATIGGAYILRPDATSTPTMQPTPTVTATAIPPTPTVTPSSPEGTVLNEYLTALEEGNFQKAAESLSDYSLAYALKTRDEVVDEFRNLEAQSMLPSAHVITGRKVLEDNKITVVTVVLTIKSAGEENDRKSQQYILYREGDAFRVNYGSLIDYKLAQHNSISDPSNQISVIPYATIRSLEETVILIDIATFGGTFWIADFQPSCTFANGTSALGEAVAWPQRGTKLVFKGLYSTYPVSCSLPELRSGGATWQAPKIQIEYSP